jgi:hypothetical protein
MTYKTEKIGNILFIKQNEHVVEKLQIYPDPRHGKILTIEEVSDVSYQKILKLKPNEISHSIELSGEKKFNIDIISDYLRVESENGSTTINILITIKPLEWDKPIKLLEFIPMFTDAIKKIEKTSIQSVTELQDETGWYDIDINLLCPQDTPLEDTLNLACKELLVTYQNTLDSLVKLDKEDVIVKLFKFPNEYKTICSQYIIWFGEFLENYGINANVSIANTPTSTKLIIETQNSSKTVKDEINNLLNIYLHLPEFTISNNEEYLLSNNITYFINQLQFQVDSLKSQLQLKNATIELQQSTISNLKFHNNTVENEKIISRSIQEDEIPIFGDGVKLVEYKIGPLKISPRKLISKLKDITKT